MQIDGRILRLFVISLAFGLMLNACGSSATTSSDTTGPTISSLIYNSIWSSVFNEPIETTGSTITSDAIIVATFSDGTDSATVTTETVTMTCDGANIPLNILNQAAVDGPENEYNITMTDTSSFRFDRYNSCELTFSTGIMDSDGNAMSATVTYSFTMISALHG